MMLLMSSFFFIYQLDCYSIQSIEQISICFQVSTLISTSILSTTTQFVERARERRLIEIEEITLFKLCNRHDEEYKIISEKIRFWEKIVREFFKKTSRTYSHTSIQRRVINMTNEHIEFLLTLKTDTKRHDNNLNIIID